MKRYILKIAMLCMLLCMVCGCGKTEIGEGENGTGTAIAVVMSNVQGFPAITEKTVNSLYDELAEGCKNSLINGNGKVVVIVNDGSPSVILDENIERITTKITDTKMQSKADSLAAAVVKAAAKGKAVHPEINTLEALNLAVKIVKAAEGAHKTVLFYGNGLQTTGILDMTKQDLLEEGVGEEIGKYLVDNHMIEPMHGITIRLIGLGQVSDDAVQKIPKSTQYKIEEFWRSIINEAGGNVIINSDVLYGEEGTSLPEVSEILFPEDELEAIAKNEIPQITKMDENSAIRFFANSAVLLNEEEARKILDRFAEYLKYNREEKLYLVGTTATTGELESGIALSHERALVCAEILVELGVDTDQVDAVGIGHKNHALKVNDLDANGNLIERLAKHNRAVYIVKQESEFVKEVLN